MSKFTVANRKFLEEQVKLAIREQLQEPSYFTRMDPVASAAYEDSKFSYDDIVSAFQNVLSGFYNEKNKIQNFLFHGGDNLRRAIDSIELTKGRALVRGSDNNTAKNKELLDKIKSFFTVFGDLDINAGDWIDPENYDVSNSTKKWIKASSQYELDKAKVRNNILYSKLYDKLKLNSMLLNFKNIIVDKEELESKKFFERCARAGVDAENFALFILEPIWSKGEDLELLLRRYSKKDKIPSLLEDVKDMFSDSFRSSKEDDEAEKKEKQMFINLYEAFLYASKVDPQGDFPIEEWYNLVKKVEDGEIKEDSIAKLIPILAVCFTKFEATQKLIQHSLKIGSGYAFVLVLLWDLMDPFGYLIPRVKITTAFNNAAKKIEDIQNSKPAEEAWSFSEQENEQWKKEILVVVDELTKAHKELLNKVLPEVGNVFNEKIKDRYAKLIKLDRLNLDNPKKQLGPALNLNITSENIGESKRLIYTISKMLKSHMDDQRSFGLGDVFGNAVDKLNESTIITEGFETVGDYLNTYMQKQFVKKWEISDTNWDQNARAKDLEKILDAYNLISYDHINRKYAAVDTMEVNKLLQEVGAVAPKAAKLTSEYSKYSNGINSMIFGKEKFENQPDENKAFLKTNGMLYRMESYGAISNVTAQERAEQFLALQYRLPKAGDRLVYGRILSEIVADLKKSNNSKFTIAGAKDQANVFDLTQRQGLASLPTSQASGGINAVSYDLWGPFFSKKIITDIEKDPTLTDNQKKSRINFIKVVRKVLKLHLLYLLHVNSSHGTISQLVKKVDEAETFEKKVKYLAMISGLDRHLYKADFDFEAIINQLEN